MSSWLKMKRETLRMTWELSRTGAFFYRLWHHRDIALYKKRWREDPVGMTAFRLRRAKLRLAHYRELELPDVLIRHQQEIVDMWERKLVQLHDPLRGGPLTGEN